jgi:hypothetical protein
MVMIYVGVMTPADMQGFRRELTPSPLCSSWLMHADLPNRLADLPEEEHAAEVLRIWKLLHYLKESNRRMQAQFSGAPCVSGQHHYSMYSRPQWRRQQLQQRQQQQEQAAADLAALYHELYILSAFAKSWW